MPLRIVPALLLAFTIGVTLVIGVSRAEAAGIPPLAARQDDLGGLALLGELRGGGYVLLFRHAATDYSRDDTDRQNLENCDTQRNLSDIGRQQSAAIGEAFRQLAIPVGAVLASPYCRTLETARLAFGAAEPSADLINELSDTSPGGRERLTAALRTLLAAQPAAGTNTVLISHLLNIEDAIGQDIEEGEAAVAWPDGAGGFAIVARVPADAWDSLEQP